LTERGHHGRISVRRCDVEKSNYRQRRLLRARRERPGGCAAEECDEVAPSHAKLPVEDKAYQRAVLCVTAKLARQGRCGSSTAEAGQRHNMVNVRFAPTATVGDQTVIRRWISENA